MIKCELISDGGALTSPNHARNVSQPRLFLLPLFLQVLLLLDCPPRRLLKPQPSWLEESLRWAGIHGMPTNVVRPILENRYSQPNGSLDISQNKTLAAAQSFIDLGLKDAGYEYINVDVSCICSTSC